MGRGSGRHVGGGSEWWGRRDEGSRGGFSVLGEVEEERGLNVGVELYHWEWPRYNLKF